MLLKAFRVCLFLLQAPGNKLMHRPLRHPLPHLDDLGQAHFCFATILYLIPSYVAQPLAIRHK
jgi:hypothetical protein